MVFAKKLFAIWQSFSSPGTLFSAWLRPSPEVRERSVGARVQSWCRDCKMSLEIPENFSPVQVTAEHAPIDLAAAKKNALWLFDFPLDVRRCEMGDLGDTELMCHVSAVV